MSSPLPYTYAPIWARREDDFKRISPTTNLFTTERVFRALLIMRSLGHTVSLVHICCLCQTFTVPAGPGGGTSARVKQDHILTSEQAQSFTLEEVFGGTPAGSDFNYGY
jgi:hypothetical protein